MQFNLRHFITKRRLNLLVWANNNNISSIEDYDHFMKNGEFSNDLFLRAELEKEFEKNKELKEKFSALAVPIENKKESIESTKGTETTKVVEMVSETKLEKKTEEKTENEQTEVETEQLENDSQELDVKVFKKKRLKTKEDDV